MKITSETTVTYSWEDIVTLLRDDAVMRLEVLKRPMPDLGSISVEIQSPALRPTFRVTVPNAQERRD